MAQSVTEIDQLIEQGLSRYGEGELDEALLLWERVLAIDPENAQANSYVDYVRMNYELLTGEGNTEHSGPFGIGDDEPEYQIEILPGDVVEPAAAAPLFMDAHDEGWAIGDESGGAAPPSPGAMTVELEADEPPVGGDPGTFESHPPAGDPGTFESPLTGEVSFEDATREYHGGAGRPASAPLPDAELPGAASEFVSEVTPGFGSPEDRSQTTDVRRRDLGFVQPTEASPRAAPAPPELKVTPRTPGSQVIPVPAIEPAPYRAPTAARELDDEGAAGRDEEPGFELETPPAGVRTGSDYASLELDHGPALATDADAQAALDLVGRADTRPAVVGVEHDAPALSSSRPTPRAPILPAKPPPAKPRSPAPGAQPPNESTTRGLPLPANLPPELGIAAAPTQDMSPAVLDPLLAGHRDRPPPTEPPPDFGDNPTNQIASRMAALRPSVPDDPVISAPTRQLGLRNERRAATEDETTGHFEFPLQRVVPRGSGKLDVMGLDPIDARSAEILEEVDRDAPANEPREDRTRRRITALLERATAWGLNADLERSVTAVDLALSEDPNSALAQKLIQRNRDTIMNAFQGFLGDLQRTPVLARPLHELGSAPISPRAAFLLSRVDGTLSLDEILDVSGMPRLEAYRYLCQLFLRGILR